MNLKNTLSYYKNNIISIIKNKSIITNSKNKDIVNSAELMRNIHSIEKGLSIENPRLGFGKAKIDEILKQVSYFQEYKDGYFNEISKMAVTVLNKYLEFHVDNNYSDNTIDDLKLKIKKYDYLFEDGYGGVVPFKKSNLKFNINEIEEFFETRHSIRDFSNKPVDKEKLVSALRLAQKAPSACNRQGVRAYVIENNNDEIKKWITGVGGFENSVNKYILITAKQTAYRWNEFNQYIVSASMYAAYLSLTLHLYGFGACVVQREVIWNKKWNNIRKNLNISNDEQAICLLCVGNLKDNFNVPVSHRLENDFFKFI